ncbi:hypothetical protein BKA70DRAFT_1228128 [Coprinopsis sp. MPI-PUGE-AT-0042]|nr:hypothetical protein BKA70DRAFT_1228128 [Coprinopsis sp. MPI-PUGE-AT-0042]
MSGIPVFDSRLNFLWNAASLDWKVKYPKRNAKGKAKRQGAQTGEGRVGPSSSQTANSYPARNVTDDHARAPEKESITVFSRGTLSQGVHPASVPMLPQGFFWDHQNYSCAYDALFGIMLNLWNSERLCWQRNMTEMGPLCQSLSDGFQSAMDSALDLETVRDGVRRELTLAAPNTFPTGRGLTSMDRLMEGVFGDEAIGNTELSCPLCRSSYQDDALTLRTVNTIYPNAFRSHFTGEDYSIADSLYCQPASVPTTCPNCGPNSRLNRLTICRRTPRLIIVEVVDRTMILSPFISFLDNVGSRRILKIRGSIYLGNAHFTSRYIDRDNNVWYHDGATSGRFCKLDGKLTTERSLHWLKRAGERQLSYVVYAEQ